MQKTVPVLLTAAVLALAVTACSGGKSGSSSTTTTTTTTTTASSPGTSPAASPAASAAAASPAATSMSMASTGGVGNGAAIYTSNCSSCHQANGKGQPGVFPPLAGNAVVTGDATKVITIVKNGLSGKISVNGTSYNGQMPAWKSSLSDADIAHVVSYVRTSWGNKGTTVTQAQVSAVK